MKKTRKKLSSYWDGVLSDSLPSYCGFKKMEEELKEHYDFINWMFKRVLLPLMTFYVVMGIALDMNVFGSLFLSLLVFIYSNFLPDVDMLIRKTDAKYMESLWYERYLLLFLAPLIVYYIVRGRARPLYSMKARCFHNATAMAAYGIFLLMVGSIFWTETLKRLMFPAFGMLGFGFHLLVDAGHGRAAKRGKPKK